MAQCLTWRVLNRPQTNACLEANNLEELRVTLKRVEDECSGELLHSRERTAAQIGVLLDLYGHVILFSKASQLAPFKVSTLFGIVHHVHETSMCGRYTRAESYDLLRQLIVQHSVHRPPYSTMVFNVREVRDIDTYLMSTYYRHYKMYVFCFVPQEVATLRTVMVNDISEAAPAHLPPLTAAMTEEAWKEKMQEAARTREEAEMEGEVSTSEAVSTAQRLAGTLNGPEFNPGIREQLEAIRDSVSKHSADRLDAIEEKLAVIETKVNERQGSGASRSASRSASKKKK
ncbi:hypothetical protein ABB37_05024 [Leptomonas pyrrhocoris]|uniref:Uncharacterized protein n=1 Tax=Leptomonas pyrrhocoris TaxID=157538 RepID=A0A0M9G0Q7_LEPPY|nr:hypothetical protein ABB37_05024 [Leptomonas pyrrhocoris]XP_015658424.1 hypothetical protein ABB37_05024 [Leptomonas pyrrhocoris]XP_015658425.1 hypothetical protein ABB37_05024 [Leptomonas pyrrhocoris]KPA79984.1 hypothetical protein ABB37_05024 [Leptomonas pyrrhocoris]KPA79985.1 hypothetical protein ABB37_05024 [Leptomonas pyrrhocoris]KPA79986.1 hypothetical protein ABB37_05024 [Leptomonas pyrrhocoris]|eukprot:XP_015658423.1 hypothetical protein ABB37_05024 [Leptomonas pyrrhocoris]